MRNIYTVPLFKYIPVPVLTILFLLATNVLLAQSRDTDRQATFKFKTVVIDAGHGGKDPGAHGVSNKEKDIALAIALKLRNAINSELPSVKTVMTRSTDVFVELSRRAEIANDAKADLFISIHCNSSPQRTGTKRGALLLVYGYHRKGEQMEALRENASIYQEKDYSQKYKGYKGDDPAYFILLNVMMQTYRAQSIKFGKMVDEEFTQRDGRRSDHVHEQGLLVLAHSAMPSVLVETGFVNNPQDEKYLSSDEGQNEVAQSLLRALKKYKKDFERN
ncbi:N-acetylmuramoyl-L-alanine amidase family protein [Mucilaginibacter myungsuensis]|uniref:N-acetylmuramoyl-L-alanine amidase n=1 Tax=Mucilaginibacter myungsuensis TaxID=649104 RepID=A0A929PXB0_9SPHI|nr:N-acetylmuramoyl-L-alanine amidase [Mucilaginibacter myungsuensis]MBE9662047.1 N-acetylmuramoyl-L-alanine amidase [Mucilaginibacter myungsuensis]MDN3599520.1 N-acetylmuramoyl-L-alanine amidase [Mucilaginibacter myungsuensis]